MKRKNEPKKIGSIKLEPLREKFFDMKPADMGKKGPTFGWVTDYHRFLAILGTTFLILTFIFIYIQGRNVFQNSQQMAFEGYEEFQQGVTHLLKFDAQSANASFDQAKETFQTLQNQTSFLTEQANRLQKNNLYLGTATTLFTTALQVTEIGKRLASLVEESATFPQRVFSADTAQMMALIHQKNEELQALIDLSTQVQQKLTTLNLSILPSDLQVKFAEAQEKMGVFLGILLEGDKDLTSILNLLGDKLPHRYLILFQNNDEIRATGGFIGSYMIMDVNDGAITKMETKDIYESDGQLGKFVPAPPGIDIMTDQLYMRDANYSPDFPTSAQELMWFLEQSKGPSVDSVIALDPTLIENLLTLTGPLKSPELPFELNSTNFTRLLSFYTEAKLSEGSTPKQLLFDLIPSFKEKLTQVKDLPAVVSVLKKMIQEGHFQLYSKDEGIEQLAHKYGFSGQMIPPAKKTDYLSVISTSVGGNKSDAFMESTLDHSTLIDGKGIVIDELSIQKTNRFSDQDRQDLESLITLYGSGKTDPQELRRILGEGANSDYMRVYVPLGTTLQAITGVKQADVLVTEDLGYTVFGFKFPRVATGEKQVVHLRYKLPYKLILFPGDNYRFMAEKQAGVDRIHLVKHLKVAESLVIKKAFPEPLNDLSSSPVLDEAFDGPKFFISAVVKQ